MKISKKQLKEEAEKRKAYYFVGNVYSYENIIHYLSSLCYETEENKLNYNNEIEKTVNRIIENTNANYFETTIDLIFKIKNIKHDYYTIEQIFYSAGLYGNNGQMHELKLFKKDQIIGLYYMYY